MNKKETWEALKSPVFSKALKKFRDEMKPFHNDICVVGDTSLARLVGVAEDERDMYYIVRPMNPKAEYWMTAVGACISLKGQYERYEYMEQCFGMNGSEREVDFKMEVDDSNGPY